MIESEIVALTKKNTEGELIVILFESCNLNCQFCSQDHKSTLGVDTILEKIAPITNAFNLLKERDKTAVIVNIMGGELFDDALPDKVFDDYLVLINSIKTLSQQLELPVKINIVTNLVWEKTDRVLNFINKANVNIATSYDPAGRFNPKQFEIFKKNIIQFSHIIKFVNVIMTRPNIKKFMSGDAVFFEYLYNNFNVVFDNYSQGQGNPIELLLPRDYELRDFYKFMLDTWPNCTPFNTMPDKNTQPMFCMRTMYVYPDSTFGGCGSIEKVVNSVSEYKKEKTVILLKKQETMIENNWFKDYDCLTCEHMQRCSFSCFLNHHIRDSRTQEECWLKEVYDYADQKS